MKKISVFILMLTILTNITSFGGITNKTNNKASSQKQISGTRYGSKNVGYVTKPSNWFNFFDPDSSPNTVQITRDGVNIVTLDVIIANGEATSNEAALVIQEKYLNSGIKKENITIKDTNINGYKGKKVRISFPDGTLFIANFIDYNGNIYFVSQEGLPEYENELSEVINTWNPVK
ncbi:hypothetical protein [Leptotrichia shahii]|uniref:hypothetical protein n=1 Tax=Leptotrichia shahii TaxID=157691 RepID=UPI0028D601E6|nr:hypothetical protein [Leptotrichia shahii]